MKKIDLQFFADPADPAETGNSSEPKVLTFDELLENKEYQSEYDRRVNELLKKHKGDWEKEAEKQRNEAERLAQMTADEKHRFELEQAETRATQAEARLNAYALKETALEIATEKGIPSSLLKVIDYTKETAETIKGKLDDIEEVYKQAVQSGINEAMKEKTPRSIVKQVTQGGNKPRESY